MQVDLGGQNLLRGRWGILFLPRFSQMPLKFKSWREHVELQMQHVGSNAVGVFVRQKDHFYFITWKLIVFYICAVNKWCDVLPALWDPGHRRGHWCLNTFTFMSFGRTSHMTCSVTTNYSSFTVPSNGNMNVWKLFGCILEQLRVEGLA